jgi:hypothetical protein
VRHNGIFAGLSPKMLTKLAVSSASFDLRMQSQTKAPGLSGSANAAAKGARVGAPRADPWMRISVAAMSATPAMRLLDRRRLRLPCPGKRDAQLSAERQER